MFLVVDSVREVGGDFDNTSVSDGGDVKDNVGEGKGTCVGEVDVIYFSQLHLYQFA